MRDLPVLRGEDIFERLRPNGSFIALVGDRGRACVYIIGTGAILEASEEYFPTPITIPWGQFLVQVYPGSACHKAEYVFLEKEPRDGQLKMNESGMWAWEDPEPTAVTKVGLTV